MLSQPETELKNRILFVNDDVIIINKLAGEAMEGAKKGIIDLPKLLENEYGSVHAVHRLDVPVTGCALFARNPKSSSYLSFKISNFKKIYWAIAELSSAFDKLPENGNLIHYIETNSKTNKSIAHNKPDNNLKEAKLIYKILGKGTNYGFMEIELITGRHHQIRAQLAAVGIHIKGDLKYGAKRSEKNGGFRLHAYSLEISNPSINQKDQNENIKVCALPPNMDNLWQAFADLTKF